MKEHHSTQSPQNNDQIETVQLFLEKDTYNTALVLHEYQKIHSLSCFSYCLMILLTAFVGFIQVYSLWIIASDAMFILDFNDGILTGQISSLNVYYNENNNVSNISNISSTYNELYNNGNISLFNVDTLDYQTESAQLQFIKFAALILLYSKIGSLLPDITNIWVLYSNRSPELESTDIFWYYLYPMLYKYLTYYSAAIVGVFTMYEAQTAQTAIGNALEITFILEFDDWCYKLFEFLIDDLNEELFVIQKNIPLKNYSSRKCCCCYSLFAIIVSIVILEAIPNNLRTKTLMELVED